MNAITRNICATVVLAVAAFTSAHATEINSTYTGANNGLWNVPTNWSPNMVPMNSLTDTYNVTITSRFVGLNVDTTISNLTLNGTSGRVTATDRNLTVEGTTSMLAAGRLTLNAVSAAEVKFDVGALANFSGTTLNSGSYFLSAAPGKAAKLQFDGANIVTNAGTIVLTGPGAAIVNENGGNALANFSTNNNFIRFTDGAGLTATNAFTNNGFFVVRPGSTATFAAGFTSVAGPGLFAFPGNVEVFGTSAGPSQGNGLFHVTGGALGNYNATTKTLSDARFRLASAGTATSTLRFPGADIVHNAAQLEVVGPNTHILDENGLNGLRNLASNSFYFMVARRAMSVPGDFANTGSMDLYGGGELTVSGNMTNSDYLGVNAFDIHRAFIAPGFAPSADSALSSKLTVLGNFTSGAASQLFFEIMSPSITTSMQVNGTTALDGELLLYFTADDTLISSADTLTLIESNGGFLGGFDNVASGQRVNAFFYGETNPVGSFVANYSGTAFTITDYQPVPQLTGAVSRKTHGTGESYDVDLLADEPGVECRSSNGNHTLVFTFSKDVVSGSAAVESGSGNITGSPVFAGNTMAVNLTGVTNAQTMTLQLSDVADRYAQELPDTDINVSFLIGDTNGDKGVNSGDATDTRNRSGETTDGTNFRSDVNTDGTVNVGDSFLVRKHSGTSAPWNARPAAHTCSQ